MEVKASVDSIRLTGTLVRFVRVVDQSVKRTSRAGLGLSELGILGQVDRGNDLPSVIAKRLRFDPPRVTRLANQLVQLGYLDRGRNPEDRRRCPLRLTDTGKAELDSARKELGVIVSSLLERMDDTAAQHLVQGIDDLQTVLDELQP